jgi:hypothetical protein
VLKSTLMLHAQFQVQRSKNQGVCVACALNSCQPASGSAQAYVISTARARAHHATPFQNSSFLVFGLGQECQNSLSAARSSSAKNTSAYCHASHLVDESVRSFLNATAPAARIPLPPQTPPTLVICLELVHDGCCMCRLYSGGF